MAGGHGGKRDGSGRKAIPEKHAQKIANYTDMCAEHMRPAFWKLWEMVQGGERVELKYEPAGSLTRKDVLRGEDGEPILDEKGKYTPVEVLLYPELDADHLILVEKKVTNLQPDVRAIIELNDRVMGKARQAVELTGDDGEAIRHAVTIYLPDNGRGPIDAGDKAPAGTPGGVA